MTVSHSRIYMFRLLRTSFLAVVASLVLVLVPRVVRAEGEAPVPLTEAQFIALAGAEKPGDTPSPEQNRPHEPAKAIEEPKAAKEEEPDAGSSDDADSGSGDDADADDAAESGDDSGTDDADAGTKEDEDEGEGDEDDGPAITDAAFKEALAAEGASTSLEDIPEAARPLVAKKLKDLEAGFFKATRRLADERQAAQTFRAEERFRKERPADFIVSMLLERPEIAELVNERIGELEGNNTAVEGHKALIEKARRDAMTAEQGEDTKAREATERTERYVTLGRAAARAAGIPFDMGVEEGIAAHILINGDISEAQIRQIAKNKAAIYQRQLRQDKRSASGKYVADKVKDRKTAGLKIKPGQGSAPSPGPKRVARNDDEFIQEFVGRPG